MSDFIGDLMVIQRDLAGFNGDLMGNNAAITVIIIVDCLYWISTKFVEKGLLQSIALTKPVKPVCNHDFKAAQTGDC